MLGDRECPDCGEMTLFEKGNRWECSKCGAKYTAKEMEEFEAEDEVEDR